MKSSKIYLTLFVISACIISYEIISTRVSSVIFESNYGFIILSLAILGLGSGGIYFYYRLTENVSREKSKILFNYLILTALAFLFYIITVTVFKITSPFIYFFLLIIPFFFAGIVYALIFKTYAEKSFKLYASDLAGAAFGAAGSPFIINILGASNAVIMFGVLILCLSGFYYQQRIKKKTIIIFYSLLILSSAFLVINGSKDFLGRIPIGNFDEKDFYYVYPNAAEISEIIESRWSIYGRSDLVQYSNQDQVKQLFIDGAAGSQMYRFDGNIKSPDALLYNLLIRHSGTIPFFFLNQAEKNNLLVIGPGGGKEVLVGLLSGIKQITGVEINPDFVNIVKDYKNFNGGIYTSFPYVKIEISDGRHFIKKSDIKYDLIVMALPSTKQMQNIEALAENENYLLTVEALYDYIKKLTDGGELIITLHNEWELLRMIITAISAFKEYGVSPNEALYHFGILETDYAPTIVIKKKSFTRDLVINWQNIIRSMPKGIPVFTYLPFGYSINSRSVVNNFLIGLKENRFSLEEYINNDPYNIEPCRDDSPYFYKVNKGVPKDYSYLASGLILFNVLIIGIPFTRIKKKFIKDKAKKIKVRNIIFPLTVFILLGLGFMILEISLFQKMILYLGSPTISLSILLSSLLIGMGLGSYYGNFISRENHKNRLLIISLLITAAGILFFFIYPSILNMVLKESLIYRGIISFLIILPFGLLLGVPFPTALHLLRSENNENLIPWMYGINGTMSVLGSVLAVIISIMYGFTVSFFVGLFFYLLIFLITRLFSKKVPS
ncbi:MAG: hypothetical protein ACM339_04665 [Ignavibacteria bacterium]